MTRSNALTRARGNGVLACFTWLLASCHAAPSGRAAGSAPADATAPESANTAADAGPASEAGVDAASGGAVHDGGTLGEDASPAERDAGTVTHARDPGKGAWRDGTPEQCGLEPAALADDAIATYAVFRRGLRCHSKGSDSPAKMYSATKTLGGVAIGRAAYLTRALVRTGPGTGPILTSDRATDWLGSVSYNPQATLGHVMAMCAQSADLSQPVFVYDGLGLTQINSMMGVVTKALGQLPEFQGLGFAAFVEAEVFARLGMEGSRFLDLGLATGWEATLSDMAKLGALIMHRGVYGGEALLGEDWVYRMTHPAFEAANPAYGQLVWLNSRGNAQGGGGDLTATSTKHMDPCAPAALWPAYPHAPSTAADCRPAAGRDCQQTFDVGVASAEGLNGQFIVMHPGLDLVIVAQNLKSSDGVRALWDAVRPAIVARDARFRGDEAAFCAAYAANDYAPDL